MLYNRLSWGLLYAALVTTMSILMSIIATYTALFPNSDFFVIFSLIFLYGISSVSRTVMKGKETCVMLIYPEWCLSIHIVWQVLRILRFFPPLNNNDLYNLYNNINL